MECQEEGSVVHLQGEEQTTTTTGIKLSQHLQDTFVNRKATKLGNFAINGDTYISLLNC